MTKNVSPNEKQQLYYYNLKPEKFKMIFTQKTPPHYRGEVFLIFINTVLVILKNAHLGKPTQYGIYPFIANMSRSFLVESHIKQIFSH